MNERHAVEKTGVHRQAGPVIAAELARSGPLRLDLLSQRVARLHGFQRTGREILDRVAAAIPRACRQTKDSAGVFVWPPGADPLDGTTWAALSDADPLDRDPEDSHNRTIRR